MKPQVMVPGSAGDMCQFCLSNGEPLEQCRSHQLKTADGRVSCPILRAFVCPHCKATGDHAHTQRYCPLNRDGRFNSAHGASVVDLRKKKNAAGRTIRSRWSQSSYPTTSLPSPKPLQSPDTNPAVPKFGLVNQPPSLQLTLYRHYQYLQFYR